MYMSQVVYFYYLCEIHKYLNVFITCYSQVHYLYLSFCAAARRVQAVDKRLRWGIIISNDKQWACRPLVATCA